MKKRDYFSILIIVLLLGVIVPLSMCERPVVDLYMAALQKENDSLKKVVAFKDSIANIKEVEYRASLGSVESKYKNQLASLEKKYQREKNKLRELSFDEQVALLDSNLCSPISPVPVVLNEDTTVLIIPEHVVNINETYLERDMLSERVILADQQIDTLNYYIKSGLEIIDLKNNIISGYQEIGVNNNKIILDLKNSISQQAITNKKQRLRALVIGLASGVIIGTTITLL